jgi:nitrogen fixation NifU-like protein
MNELDELYQELILDHGRHPRNFRIPASANHQALGHNPLCGDRLTLALELENGVVKDIGFQGSGCAISTASASTMTEAVKGKTVAEIEALFDHFHDLVTGKAEVADDLPPKLAAFHGVSGFPMRVKCATLAWHTLKNALSDQPTASTE